jgi:hypothetical protein
MKKLIKILVAVIIIVIILLLLTPILFRSQIIDAVKSNANESLNAELDFADVDISIIKDFPSLSIELSDLSIIGKEDFAGIPLLKAKEVYLATDWKSVIKSDEGITISKIYLDEPALNIIVTKEGSANYDITKESTETSSSDKSFFGDIESYEIEDGQLSYIDKSADLIASIDGLNHSGTGKFQDVNFDLATQTSIESIDVKNGSIPYLRKAKLDADITLGIDLDKQLYTFKENVINLNDLAFAFLGHTQLLEEGYDLDLKINAANNSVASILSLIPTAFTADYGNITSDGTGSLSGYVKGIYNSEKNVFPDLDLKVNLTDGLIKYPALKLPIKDILLDMAIKSNKNDWTDLSIDIPNYSFILDEDKVNGDLQIRNVMGDPQIISNTAGKIDLYKVSQAYPMESMTLRSGIIEGDVHVNAKQSDITNTNYRNIKMSGNIAADDIDIDYTEDIPIKIDRLDTKFSPQEVNATTNKMMLGNSDFQGKMSIRDPLQLILGDEQPETSIKVKSKTLDLNQLMTLSEPENPESDTSYTDETPFINYIVNGEYTADQVIYEDYNIKNMSFDGRYKDEKLSLTQSSMSLDNQTIKARGQFNNVMHYVFNEETLSGELFIEADKLNANQYINDTESTESIEQVVEVPTNLDLTIYPKINSLQYDDYTLKNLDGKISMKDGIAELTNGVAKLFNGKINFEGAYNAQDISNPLFDFKYNMSDMNFAQLFEKSESFKLLAPIAKYMEGIFNSTLEISGPLTKDMFPDLYKIDASGFIETINGKVGGVKPLEMLGDALGISSVKDWDIKDSKNWFEVKEGFVILMPQDYNVEDMQFTVGGKHSIDQNLDYHINARIPRERLSKAQLGKTLEMGMSEIEKQAKSRGVNIDLGDFVYLDAYITGTLLKPKVKIIPVGSGGKTLTDVLKDEFVKQTTILKYTIRQEIDKVTSAAKDSVSRVIDQKTEVLKDTLKSEAQKQTDKITEQLKDKAKEKLDSTIATTVTDSLAQAAKDKVGDIIGNSGNTQIDSIKDKVSKWNPFKKKKN